MSQIATESEPGQNINLTDYQYSLELTMKLTPHKGMCHAHTSGHRCDLSPLKRKGPSYCCSAANDIRAFQLALGIAAEMRRISCGKSLQNMKGRTASPTSCSRTFLTGPGRKLSAKPNWNVANNILGCQRTLRRGDTARPGTGDMRSFSRQLQRRGNRPAVPGLSFLNEVPMPVDAWHPFSVTHLSPLIGL